MSRPVFDFEFAFGRRERRSTAWKVVVPKRSADVYLSNLDGGGEFHVSLHERGRCHIKAIERQQLRGAAGPWGGRKMIQTTLPPYLAEGESSGYGGYPDIWWPKEISPGVTMPFRLGIASSQLRLLPLEIADRPQLRWVEASLGHNWFNEVAFFMTDGEWDGESWPGATMMGTKLEAKHRLRDGRLLWLTSRSHPQTPEGVMWTHAYRPSVSPHPEMEAVDRSREDLSSLVMTCDEKYGSFAIWETGE